MTQTLFEAHDVSRCFAHGGEEVRALLHASCRVTAGERIAVVGPSGSGKSTLLSLMAGLDDPTSGTVQWPALGPASMLRPEHIAVVFQTVSLIPALTCLENVELPLVLAGAGKAARTKAQEALIMLGLAELADHLPDELSGGQAQRVAMARAIAGTPQLLLADEPTGQLDHDTGTLLLDQVLAWQRRSGAALVIATHDEAVARRMSQVWRMDHGRLAVTPQGESDAVALDLGARTG
jgi:putative ABC transport system ATP-binding protein/lipoprotein-releasing system ATP-binding protein